MQLDADKGPDRKPFDTYIEEKRIKPLGGEVEYD